VPAVILLKRLRNVFMASILRYEHIHWMLSYVSVHTGIYPDVLYLYAQDTIVIVPPYPYCIEEDHHDVALEDCWFARHQLFFKCFLRPKHGREPKNSNCKAGPGIYRYIHVYLSMYVFNHFIPDDLLQELVFFNTFAELHLPIKGPMEDTGVVKLYKPSPTLCLYVAPAENMVGRVPLKQLFLAGNATLTNQRRSLTCTASTRIPVAQWAVLTQQL
jgi:hypothetical protein